MRTHVFEKLSLAGMLLFAPFVSWSQEDMSKLFDDDPSSKKSKPVFATFKTTRIVNAQSNETMKKHQMNLSIAHRFGDAAGKYGGPSTFYGTDNSSDIRIAFDYGVTDRLTIGISRAKGATAQRQMYEGSLKWKALEQTSDNRVPIGVTLFGNAVVCAMESNVNPTVPDHFETFSDRWSYVAQAILVRKFGSRLSLALLPSFVHYNTVSYGDGNDTYALGIGGRLKLSKRLAFIADYFYVWRQNGVKEYYASNGLFLYNPLGVGIEIETGGHVFQITFMNSTAILENQYIPYTSSSWGNGEFRWGFNFTRTFSLSKS
jgi:hypothetical protein